MGRKDKFYVVAINLIRDKHGELINKIIKEASDREQSLSAFCISVLKQYFYELEIKNVEKDND